MNNTSSAGQTTSQNSKSVCFFPIGEVNMTPRQRVLFAAMSGYGWTSGKLMLSDLSVRETSELLGWSKSTVTRTKRQLGLKCYDNAYVIGPVPKRFVKVDLNHAIWDLGPEAICLYMVFQNFFLMSSVCWAKTETLARESGLSVSQVRKMTRLLNEAGMIVRTKGKYNGRYRQKRTVYTPGPMSKGVRKLPDWMSPMVNQDQSNLPPALAQSTDPFCLDCEIEAELVYHQLMNQPPPVGYGLERSTFENPNPTDCTSKVFLHNELIHQTTIASGSFSYGQIGSTIQALDKPSISQTNSRGVVGLEKSTTTSKSKKKQPDESLKPIPPELAVALNDAKLDQAEYRVVEKRIQKMKTMPGVAWLQDLIRASAAPTVINRIGFLINMLGRFDNNPLEAPVFNRPREIRSKFDGQIRVKCKDGEWRNKALPPENGSGTLATDIIKARRTAWELEQQNEPPPDPNAPPPEWKRKLEVYHKSSPNKPSEWERRLNEHMLNVARKDIRLLDQARAEFIAANPRPD